MADWTDQRSSAKLDRMLGRAPATNPFAPELPPPKGSQRRAAGHGEDEGAATDLAAMSPTQATFSPNGAPSFLSSSSSIAGDPDEPAAGAEELAWGPLHPCYPHQNPHVPLSSTLYHSTRIIRIKRDWMIAGDEAPTFSNLYPEILDPLLSEEQFRIIIQRLNDDLVRAFDPRGWRNVLDAVMGLLTFWIWDDMGLTAAKARLAAIEAWLERWNREVGDREGVTIIPLRRTGYMSLDIQIPDPQIGEVPAESESRPNTDGEAEVKAEGRKDDAGQPVSVSAPDPATVVNGISKDTSTSNKPYTNAFGAR